MILIPTTTTEQYRPLSNAERIEVWRKNSTKPNAGENEMSDEYKIEKNVEMPDGRGVRKTKYPFNEMDVGDSFFFVGQRNRIAAAASFAKLKTGKKFAVRMADGGFRVFRIA